MFSPPEIFHELGLLHPILRSMIKALVEKKKKKQTNGREQYPIFLKKLLL